MCEIYSNFVAFFFDGCSPSHRILKYKGDVLGGVMVFFSRTRRSLYQNRARETSFDAFSKALLAACAVDFGGTFPRLRCRKIAYLGGFRILWFQNSRGVPLCRTSRDLYSGGGKGPSELRGSPGRCNDEIFRRGMKSE